MKDSIRKNMFSVERYGARLLGRVCSPYPPAGFLLFRMFVSASRITPDKVFLLLYPFIDEFGRVLYDRRESVQTLVRLKNGARMLVDISEKTQRQIYTQKMFETGLTRYLINTLRHGDTVIDVGANVGYFTIIAAGTVGPRGQIIAVEPESRNLAALKNNIALNNYKNVIVYDCALGKADSVEILNINPLNRGGNSMLPFTKYKSGNEVYSSEEIKRMYGSGALFQEVRVRPLDDIVKENGISDIAFIKIDVEGFEQDVLSGSQNLIKNRTARSIICELTNNATRDGIIKMFLDSGYKPSHLSFSGEKISLDEESTIHPRDVLFCLDA